MNNKTSTTDSTLQDSAQAKARFEEEKNKRLRPEASSQYVNLSGEMEKDPWMEIKSRESVKDHVTFTFVGGGWAGLISGAELSKQGINDVRIIERAGDFGGVWYWNRYPGLMCDSPALVYLPLLEETGHVPTEKYVHQPEILEHAQRIGRHYNLYDKALFHTNINSMKWDGDQNLWYIKTNRGDEFTSQFIGLGTGFLSTPKLPNIAGIEKFKGKAFHAARWDYGYTGGGPNQALDKLQDKRVAVIGTGASAIQIVAPVSESAKELHVFQRTPSAVHARNNGPMDKAYFESIAKPGWQKEYNENFIMGYAGILGQPYHFGPVENLFKGDAFSEIFFDIRNVINSIPPEQRNTETVMAAIDKHDIETVAKTHKHIDDIIDDEETANALKPWYRPACKRPTFNDDYLPSFNRSNTHLIDTDGQGVSEITETGIIANGKEYPLDCIIFASGFDFSKELAHGLDFDIVGVDGIKLKDHWHSSIRTLHGLYANGFPNMFMVQLAQGADFAPNIPSGWQFSGEVIASIVSHMNQNDHKQVVVDSAYEEAWTKLMTESPPLMDLRECTPGLLSNEGVLDAKFASTQGFPEGPRAYYQMMTSWLAAGEYDGLNFS